MSKDKKQKDKEKLIDLLMSVYNAKATECRWNPNDAFDVACWFLGSMIEELAAQNLISTDELHRRVKEKTAAWVDDVFKQIEGQEHGIVKIAIKQ